MRSGILLYRCRNCGSLDKTHRVKDTEHAVVLILDRYPVQDDQGEDLCRYMHHRCGVLWRNQLGVMDLIGAKEDE